MKLFPELNNKKVLLTGGAGFIGSHLAEHFLNNNVRLVRIVDNLSTGRIENIQHLINNPKVEFIQGDLQNKNDVFFWLKGIDLVCHQAATGSVPRSLEMPYFYHENNVITFLNIIEGARREGIKRIVYASSSSVYGDSEELPKQENKTGKSLSIYATTKMMNELDSHVYSKCYDMEIIGLRYFNIFGPRQNPEGMYAAVIPKFIDKIKNREQITINGDGTYSRDFTYVDNAVYGNLCALTTQNPESFGKAFNIASKVRITLNELVSLLEEMNGKKVDVKYGVPRKGDIPHSFAKTDFAEEKLGYEILVPFQEGLKKTFDYFSKN